MGYEIKMMIGKSGHTSAEREKDMAKPYSDGSGFETKKDKIGNDVLTGRTGHYFYVFVDFDLCKLGYQDDALNKLIQKSQDKKRRSKHFYYFYGTGDGNNEIKQDNYGSQMYPVPIKKVMEAMRKTIDKNEPYRRLEWAIALLESMSKDTEELEVMFYGH